MKGKGTIGFEMLEIGGFWGEKQRLIATESLPSIYRRFAETSRFAVLEKPYKNPFVKSHAFYDSDTAKWIESAAYVLRKHPLEYPQLEKQCDELIEKLAALARRNGYVNSHFQRIPLRIFQHRTEHELYCAGHLAEAALAYKEATGKDKLFTVADKYLDYVAKRFMIKRNTGFVTPGHEEIELALYRLYRATGQNKYRALAEFFLENRGRSKAEHTYKWFENTYDQNAVPIRNLTSAEGHCVRAMYLYCAMADMATENEDEALAEACRRVFADTLTKTYVTGGIGSSRDGESFTIPYDLPNLTAYSESCAAIGLLLFSRRMLKMENKSVYADTLERVLFNTLLSSIAMDGCAFFYENPLEINLAESLKNSPMKRKNTLPSPTRKAVFDCSCCPPNITRIIASIGDNVFTYDEDTLYLQQYIACTLQPDGGSLCVDTDFPKSGTVTVSATGYKKPRFSFRVPEWCTNFTATLNGEALTAKAEGGYVSCAVSGEFTLKLDLPLAPVYVYGNPLVSQNVGKVALTVGPVVYCLEGVDNGSLCDIAVDVNAPLFPVYNEAHGLFDYQTQGYRLSMTGTYSSRQPEKAPVTLKFIPYFYFANRGESDMAVWVRKL